VLVAMNPAALKTNLRDLPKGGTLIVNRDAFTERNLEKAGYEGSPLDDGSLDEYHVHEVPLTTLTLEALKEVDVTKREAERSKNMFALGLMSWLYHRPTEGTSRSSSASSPRSPRSPRRTSRRSRPAGPTARPRRTSSSRTRSRPRAAAGTYRNITGNQALGLGLIAASVKSGLPLFLGAYPITPASGSSRTSRGTSASASAPSRPRTRSRAAVRPSGVASAARSASARPAAPGSC
jgi:2-oxoglutarate ferredoxin oxidoreductase subunit alpha